MLLKALNERPSFPCHPFGHTLSSFIEIRQLHMSSDMTAESEKMNPVERFKILVHLCSHLICCNVEKVLFSDLVLVLALCSITLVYVAMYWIR